MSETPDEFGFTPLEEKEANDTFHLQLGLTLGEWSGIEYAMFHWFWKLSEMPNQNAARLVYYSATSLRGRTDMLLALATMPHHPYKEVAPSIPFLKKALDRVGKYSSFRNRLAHGIVVQTQNDNSCRIVRDGDISMDEGVSLFNIENAQHTFRSLKYAFRGVLKHVDATYHPLPGPPPPMTPVEGLALLSQLPTEAGFPEPLPILPENLRQMISSRMKRDRREQNRQVK